MKGTIKHLPGGRNRIQYGGTRTKMNFANRPWQVPLGQYLKPETCNICTKPQEKIEMQGLTEGWWVLPNPMTPHSCHNLIVPDHCWPESKLQMWGGPEELATALVIASRLKDNFRAERVFLINVGLQVGGSLGHPHLHAFDALTPNPMHYGDMQGYANTERLLVFENEKYAVVAGGAHAGECLIVPKDRRLLSEDTVDIADTLAQLINLGNEKFKSSAGLAPPYSIIIRISEDGTFRYADYCPLLHNWGATDFSLTTLEGTPFVLPWPHETTAAHLRGES